MVDNFELRGNRLGLEWEAGRGGLGPALGNWNVNGRWEDLWACQSPLRCLHNPAPNVRESMRTCVRGNVCVCMRPSQPPEKGGRVVRVCETWGT